MKDTLWHQFDSDEALRRLDVDQTTGLSGAEVALRGKSSGPNRVTARKGTPTWLKFLRQFKVYGGRTSEMREEEFEGVIRDALYTALQAEGTYYDSAASKLYVDRLVASLPKWWVPAQSLSALPLSDCVSGEAPSGDA